MSKLVHLDLFAGVGGVSLGVEATASYETSLLVDSDRSAAATYKRNRPRQPFWVRDLAKVTADDLLTTAKKTRGEIDLLTAGPPCQGFSKLGTRQLEDPRNELLRHTVELVEGVLPRVIMIENVPAVSWDGHSTLFDELHDVLDHAGYTSSAQVLEAWRFGVPQLRRRLFIVGVRSDVGVEPASLLPEGALLGDFKASELIRAAEAGAPECPPGLSVEEAIGDLPPLKAGGGKEISMYEKDPMSSYQRERRANATLLLNHKARAHSPAMLKKVKLIEEGGRNYELPDSSRLRAEGREYFSQAYGRLHRHGIAQTITTYFQNPGSGRFIHYADDRALTVREAARFQGFDDDFIFIGHTEGQMRHVGNAVPVQLAKAAAARVADMLVGSKAGPVAGVR